MNKDLKLIEVKEDKSPVNGFKIAKKSIEEMENVALLLNTNTIVADFDGDNVEENKIMNYFEENCPTLIVKTDKGKHFYYAKSQDLKINSKADSITVGGFQCDYKTGRQYVLIKRYGKMRESNRELTLENLPELPYFMYPLKKAENITGLKEGDGRNDALFHHLFLVRQQYGDDELENIAHFINEQIFAEPLEENELLHLVESVSSYDIEAEKKEGWMDKAESVISDLECVFFENNIMFFDTDINYYSTDLKKLEHYIQKKYRNTANFTIGGIKEVIRQMEIILSNTENKYSRDDTYILCGKELINTKKEEEPKTNTRTVVTDVIYKHSIMSNDELKEYEKNQKLGWKFLNDISCGDEQIKTVICECLGCMLAPTNHFGKIFIWYGNGANGKSVLVRVMKAIMGDLLTNANILNINDKFGLSRAYRGIANVTDDVGITIIKETGLLKSIVDGTSIEVDRKYLDPIDWFPDSQFLMCCNDIPRIQDTTKGMIRRLAFIPFKMQLEEDEIDYDLTDKLLGRSLKLDEDEKNDNALRYIMTKAILAYRQAYEAGHLTVLDEQTELLNEFKNENKDPVSSFYDFLLEQVGDIKGLCKWIENRTFDEVFAKYAEFLGYDNADEIKKMKRSFLVHFNRKLPNNIKKKNETIGGATMTKYIVT